jgi:hypothetical protein
MAESWPTGAVACYRNIVDDTIVAATVDQQSYSYVLEVVLPADTVTPTNLRLTGVRIDYGYPIALPVVLKNG